MERKTLFWRIAGVWMSGWIPLSGVAAEEMAAVSLDINIDYGTDPFYTEMWFLILIAVLLLFLLVLLIRGGRRSRRKRKALKALKKALKESEESGISKEAPNETKELKKEAPNEL